MSLLQQQDVRGGCDDLLGSLCFPIVGWDSRPVHRKGSSGWATMSPYGLCGQLQGQDELSLG